MSNDYYLTEDDYETAISNGISRRKAYVRFYVQNWNKERAITEPIIKRQQREWLKWKDQSVVSERVFKRRISKGWDPEKAATKTLKS